MPSKHATVWKALKSHLEAYPALPFVAYGGQSFDPPDNAPYLIVDDVRFDAQRKYHETDAATWQTGTLSINVMCLLQWTDLQAAEYVGKLADYFAQDSAMSYGGVTVRVSRQPTVSGAGYRDGDRFRVPLLVAWEGWV